MVEKSIIDTVEKFRSAIEKQGIRIAAIVLFGSHALGKNHIDSDIDLAIVSPDFGKDRFEEGVRLFQIACEIDPRIEPIPVSVESYENDTWVPLIYEIRKNGVEIKSL
ncbi:MAG: nucleotidyltransferase domain-containing protein [Chitinispirillaceae bacterium]|nr:nucleotidyltransferase domain-containing protein [Chitinispirillaceae bacterium]